MLVHVTGDRIGDGLLKYPVIRAYREAHPDTRLVWATEKRPSVFSGRLAPLAAGLIDEIHEGTGLGRRLLGATPQDFRRRFGVVVSTEARLRETLGLRRLRAARFVSPAARFLLSDLAPSQDYAAASSYERFRILMSLAGGCELRPVARIEVPAAAGAWAAEQLQGAARCVGLSPGAGGARKRWPVERYVQLGAELSRRGYLPVFFLGPEELALRPQIASALPHARFPEHPSHGNRRSAPASPLATIALARRMLFSVANDSGGGHLVAAGGRPVLTLFDHTSPAKFRSPYCEQHALSAADLGLGRVSDVPVEAVLEAIDRLRLERG